MVSRTSGVPNTTTTTQNTSPNSSVTNQSSTTTGSSSSRGGSTSTQNYNVNNMSSEALAALDNLISGLSGGKGNAASDNANFLREQWLEQLRASNELRSQYSKEAAFNDAAGASAAALSDALEQSMPVISAGIDAAGTSGGALSALLTQQAAEDASRTAAQLSLNAAISYGQISASALGTGAGLVQSGDPAMNALLDALGIAKGSVQKGSVTTNENNWQNSNSSQTTNSTSTTLNSGQNAISTTTSGPNKTNSITPPVSKPPASTTAQSFSTPSSYRTQVRQNGNSYSQFGL